MLVAGFETSCDETGIALYQLDSTAQGGGGRLLSHVLFSQIDLHQLYGGVVPELASRDHIKRLCPLLDKVLAEAGCDRRDLQGIAFTSGPGLAGALLTGAIAARSLAWALDIPALQVHHMEGHLLAPMLEDEPPPYPFVCLLVSGGHTQLIRVDDIGVYRFLGDTLDDAAGEAFDKTAKLLGLPYPGGPHLSRLAESGNAQRFDFPRPMTDRPGLDFSFSGLKTAAITAYRAAQSASEESAGQQKDNTLEADIAASFQQALVQTLMLKCGRALQQENLNTLVVSGGVSANRSLREQFERQFGAANVYYPRLEFCTDNGAMIALAGAIRLASGQHSDLAVTVRPRWPLTDLPAL